MDARTPPSFWVGLSLEVDTLTMGRKTIAAKVRDLSAANDARELANLKHAAEQIAEVANNMKVISDHLAKQIARLSARHPHQ